MQNSTNNQIAGSKSATADMASYFEQGRRLRSAALWNLATHLKPSIDSNDAAEDNAPPDGAIQSANPQDMEYFLAQGRQLRNSLSGSYLLDGVRAICGSLRGLAASSGTRHSASR